MALLEGACLSSESPCALSGKSEGRAEQDDGRHAIVQVVSGSGAFLDSCCVNGLLMEMMAVSGAGTGVWT